MQLSSGRNSVTTTPEQIQKLREEVINKQMLIELYVDYFGEDKRARIEEKLGKAYDFVIPIDIPSYNLQKYLLKDPNYSNAKFRNVSKTAREMIFSSPKKNFQRLNGFEFSTSATQLLKTMSIGEDEPFTFENVFDFDFKGYLLSKKGIYKKGERYEEFIDKLSQIAFEGFEGFESFDSLTKKLISSLARIDGISINPDLKITDIQNELSDLFDIKALRASISSSLASINKIFNTKFKDIEEFEKHPAYKNVCNKITEFRFKFVTDYLGKSISREIIDEYHWAGFEKDATLRREDARYPIGFTVDAYSSFRNSSMGDMGYHKTKKEISPIIRVSLDSRTAYSTVIHEGGHALQMVEKNGEYYTGFSKAIGGVYLFASFNEFYNEFLTKKISQKIKTKFNPSIKETSGSAYDFGVSLLTDFFEAYEEELKENVIDNAFEFALDLFGLDKFVMLGTYCENLRNADQSVIYSLMKDLNVKNLNDAKIRLKEHPNVYKEDLGAVATEENNERFQKVKLASTIRAIDGLVSPYVEEKNREKENILNQI